MTLRSIFLDHRFNRKLLALTVPIAVQSLMLALVAAADALMLGRFDQDAMAAVSLATQIQFVQNMLLASIAAGVGILDAQYYGKGDRIALEKIFGISVQKSVLVSLLFFAGCYFFPRELMHIFARDEILIRLGADYLRIAAWSYLFTGVSQSYLAIMRVSGHVSTSAWLSSAVVILNIILNGVFIFGLAGVPRMGVQGAALATLLARVAEFISCIAVTVKADFIKLKLRRVFQFDKLLVLDFWKYALPVLGAYMIWGMGFTSYTAILGHLGRDAAAANSIVSVVRDLMCCLCNGIAGGSAILVGNELGAGKLLRGKLYGNRLAVISFLVGGTATLLTLAVIPLVSRCIKLTPQAHSYMVGMFVILSIYMIGRCVCTIIINGVFTSGGDTCFDVYSLLVCMWGIALPCAFAGAFWFNWHVLVVFACTCLDEVGKIPWVLHHHLKYKWVKNLTR